MDRLISEQAVIDAICKVCAVEVEPSECRYRKGLFGGCKEYEAIKAIPSADPKTGHWKRRIVDGGYNADWKCSECGYKVYTDFVNYNFCPNCGARMVESQERSENVT